MPTEDDTKVVETPIATPTPSEAFADEVTTQSQFTADDIAKARAQEKAKLYPQLEKTQEELANVKKILAEQQAKEAERAAKRAEREAIRAAEKKQQEEQSLEVRDLLAKKEKEWQAQLEAERAQRESAFALLERERDFQELQTFRQSRLEQERSNIIPELIDLVKGDSKDEIEQSIAELKSKSTQIFDSVAQASQQTRKEMVGTRITAPASGPLDNDSAQSSLTPEAISKMSQAEYAKYRTTLLGTASSNRGQGLFG
ncbi:hypothetical protein UFOVP45_18 [uncultured Caudovirales phage]|uniref:Uncharacterized protein n=1 Tax=uncultured Caudovirales phage TaxID=2100421 RepID=A0A6J5KMZ2_9CAUD|nr:hypothetical protein UFOVP45_18 [uncultured Caudovirales phage]